MSERTWITAWAAVIIGVALICVAGTWGAAIILTRPTENTCTNPGADPPPPVPAVRGPGSGATVGARVLAQDQTC